MHALHRYAQPLLVQTCRPNCCVLATAVALDVLDWAGITASPVAVTCNVFNAAALDFLEQHCQLPKDEHDPLYAEWQEKRCKWLAISPDGFDAAPGGRTETGYAGHLVALANYGPSGKVLIDLSTGQFDRPAYDMTFGPVLGTVTPEPLAANELFAQFSLNGCRVQYLYRPDLDDFRNAPDWTDKTRRRELVAAIIRWAKLIEKWLQQYGVPYVPPQQEKETNASNGAGHTITD